MTDFLNRPYPLFQPAQPLRSTDLNQLREYLEAQDLATRAYLIGTGVLCGLEVSCKESGDEANKKREITISTGVGVTSDGYLILHTEQVTLGYAKEETFNLSFFKNVTGTDTLKVYELFSTAVAGGVPIGADIKDMTIVVKCEAVIAEQRSCFTSFENPAQNATPRLRYFAVGNIKTIWEQEAATGSALLTDFPCVERFKCPPPQNGQFSTLEGFIAQWNTIITNALAKDPGKLSNTLKKVFPNWKEGDFISSVNAIISQLRAAPLGAQAGQILYLHDHLRDLVCAYEELAEANNPQVAQSCVGDSLFPKFLALGVPTEPSKNRMPFYRAGNAAENREAKRYTFLRNRLQILLLKETLIDLIKLDGRSEIRITGSGAKSAPLGEQAIPFYYKEVAGSSLREKWHFEKSESGRNVGVQWYEAPSGAYPRQALSKELGKYDFFRIEGHIGKELNAGYNTIVKLRTDLNLPFEITCVRLGAPFFADDVHNEELKDVLNQLAFDTFCAEHPGLEHLGGVPQGGTFVLVYVDDVPEEIRTFIKNQNINPLEFFAVGSKKPRRIVADFCLPYSCFKAPKVNYNFLEVCPPVADFECVSLKYLASNDDNVPALLFSQNPNELRPIAKIVVSNRSGITETFAWKINEKSIDETIAGAVIDKGTDNGKSGWTGYFDLNQITEIAIELQVETPPFEANTAKKQINLCPEELMFYLEDGEDQNGNPVEFHEEYIVSPGEREIIVHFAPPGGQIDDVQLQELEGKFVFGDRNLTEQTLTIGQTAAQPGVYSLFYRFGKCRPPREIRIVIPRPEGVAAVAPPSDQALTARRTRFQRNMQQVADDTTKDAFNKSVMFANAELGDLPSTILNYETLSGQLNKLSAAAASTPTLADKYKTLLFNATWIFLDYLVRESPDAISKSASDVLKKAIKDFKAETVQSLREGWNGAELKHPLAAQYEKILK